MAPNCGSLQAQAPPDLSLTIALRPGPDVGQTPEESAKNTPVATVFPQGYPIDVEFTVTNTGDGPFAFDDCCGDRSGRMSQYAVEVTDAQGTRLPDPRPPSGIGGGGAAPVELAPEQSHVRHIYLNQ